MPTGAPQHGLAGPGAVHVFVRGPASRIPAIRSPAPCQSAQGGGGAFARRRLASRAHAADSVHAGRMIARIPWTAGS